MKQTYPDAFGGEIVGKDIASVNGNTVILADASRVTVDGDTADHIKRDIAKRDAVPYGEQYEARKVLVEGLNDEGIERRASRSHWKGWEFKDGSFIEWRNFGNHQAFAPNGWNITPID